MMNEEKTERAERVYLKLFYWRGKNVINQFDCLWDGWKCLGHIWVTIGESSVSLMWSPHRTCKYIIIGFAFRAEGEWCYNWDSGAKELYSACGLWIRLMTSKRMGLIDLNGQVQTCIKRKKVKKDEQGVGMREFLDRIPVCIYLCKAVVPGMDLWWAASCEEAHQEPKMLKRIVLIPMLIELKSGDSLVKIQTHRSLLPAVVPGRVENVLPALLQKGEGECFYET